MAAGGACSWTAARGSTARSRGSASAPRLPSPQCATKAVAYSGLQSTLLLTMIHELPAARHVPLRHQAVEEDLVLLALRLLVADRRYGLQLLGH